MTAWQPAAPGETRQPMWPPAPEPPGGQPQPDWGARPEPQGPPPEPGQSLWRSEPPAPPTQSMWHANPAPPAEPWIAPQRTGFEPGEQPGGWPPPPAPPPGAPPQGESSASGEGGHTGKSGPSTGLIVGVVLIGATVLVALALAVPALLEQLRGRGGSGNYTVGECVVQDGGDAAPADCSEPNAYQIVSQVDNLDECDPTQPTIQVDGPPTQIYCLMPAAAEAPPVTPEPEPTSE